MCWRVMRRRPTLIDAETAQPKLVVDDVPRNAESLSS